MLGKSFHSLAKSTEIRYRLPGPESTRNPLLFHLKCRRTGSKRRLLYNPEKLRFHLSNLLRSDLKQRHLSYPADFLQMSESRTQD